MKSFLFIFLTLLIFTVARAQRTNEVVIGSVDSLYSRILHEERYFWVHLPAKTRRAEHREKKYPVLYLLDGERYFAQVVGMTDLLSAQNGNDFCPEMIVVGIVNTDRFRDLTPTHESSGLWVDSASGKKSGGGETFFRFLEKELISHIDSSFPAGPYKMLIGHSLGGLMTIHALVHHSRVFNSYVAIDPSMWWDSQRLLHEATSAFNLNSFNGKALFLAMAHTQVPGMDTSSLQLDSTDGTIHPRSILELSHSLGGAGTHGLQAGFKYYDAENHGSIPLIATYDALHFIFSDYALNFQSNYYSDPAFPLAAFLKDHYALTAAKFGITADDGSPASLPPEDLVNNQGYYVMTLKQFDKAADLFSMNIKNYPHAPKAFDYLGDLYMAKGDTIQAAASYKRSLSIKENAETRKKLERIKGS